MVMYESPHRINKALKEASETFGPERHACVARELTKLYETYHRGTLAELVAYGDDKGYKGEIVLLIEGSAAFEKRNKDESHSTQRFWRLERCFQLTGYRNPYTGRKSSAD